MIEYLGNSKKIIFSGGLGSGKTEIAVNCSIELSQKNEKPVHLIDLDVIKPYFRSRHLEAELKERNIRLIAPPAPYMLADLPLLPPQVRTLIMQPGFPLVIDVGGDDAGARVLGCFNDELMKSCCQFLYVINISRPQSRRVDEILDMADLVQKASSLRITGIINNSHLLWETDSRVVQEGAGTAREVAVKLGVPLVFHTIMKGFPNPGELILNEPVCLLDLLLYRRF
jgi:hypothetical protein